MRISTWMSALKRHRTIEQLTAVLLAVSILGQPAAARAEAIRPLSWAAPALASVNVVYVTASNRSLALDNAKDYRIVMPAYPLGGQLSISGGRNVVLIGGEIRIPSEISDPSQRRALYLKNQVGTVHIEGLALTGNLAEGINLDQRLGATVQLQNLFVDTVYGGHNSNHADVLQTWGGPRVLRIDGLQATTTYQGLFLLPNQMDSTLAIDQWHFKNIDLTSTPGSGYGMWAQDGLNIVSEAVHWNRSDGTTNKSYWPSLASWPGATVGPANSVVFGSHPGIGYVSPNSTPPIPSTTSTTAPTSSVPPATGGQWMVAADGGIFSFGDAHFLGSTGGQRLNQPVVAMAGTKSGKGYWLVASDGGIFTFGDAPFLGSTGAMHLNQPIVGMAATKSGKGYWLVASDGGIFTFGDAPFLGSTGAIRLNKPIVGMAAAPMGDGYWLVASDGGIFAFGNADFRGSTGGMKLNGSIVSMAATASGRGYWLAAADGGVFTFGDAAFKGSAAGRVRDRVVAIERVGLEGGYRIVDRSGLTRSFGGAPQLGSISGPLYRPVVGSVPK